MFSQSSQLAFSLAHNLLSDSWQENQEWRLEPNTDDTRESRGRIAEKLRMSSLRQNSRLSFRAENDFARLELKSAACPSVQLTVLLQQFEAHTSLNSLRLNSQRD